MAITVELPGALRPYARGQPTLHLAEPCATVGDVLAVIGAQWPGVVDRVLDESGKVRPHVNVFVDDDSIRFLGGLDAPVSERSSIVIVPAVSGG